MPERYAIYFAPDRAHPLWLKAAQWLGRDPSTGEAPDTAVSGITRQDLSANSVSARRYGFHATIKAPMALTEGMSPAGLAAALADFVMRRRPVRLGRMKLALIDNGFLALVPAEQSAELTDFAAQVVETFDAFRARPTAEERARRLAGGRLTPRQVALVDRFGYPYVLENFQFHMTLTDRLPQSEQDRFRVAAAAHFGALAEAELLLDRLVLFHEPEAGAPFVRSADFLLSNKAGQ